MIPVENWSAPWTADDRCTQHQSALSEKDLADWLAGKPHVSFDALKKLVEPIKDKILTFVEVGSGCGYGLPVLKSFAPHIIYCGIDISESMLAYARKKYPCEGPPGTTNFLYGTAEKIPLSDSSADCVCPAAVIQHCADWRPPIKEAIRVSRRWVILHRVEATSADTFEFVNAAYDTNLPTRIINENELLTFCGLCGLTLRHQEKWGVGETRWNASYLLEKA